MTAKSIANIDFLFIRSYLCIGSLISLLQKCSALVIYIFFQPNNETISQRPQVHIISYTNNSNVLRSQSDNLIVFTWIVHCYNDLSNSNLELLLNIPICYYNDRVNEMNNVICNYLKSKEICNNLFK